MSPPATKYQLPSDFDKISHGGVYSFGPRSKSRFSDRKIIRVKHEFPGPGSYQINGFARIKQKFSFRTRTPSIL